MPVALQLVHRDATVTICHSRTRDLPAVVRQADILVAAVGRAHMVKADWIKPGAVVIDVGTNKINDPAAKNGSRLVGDVDFEAAKEVAGAITPVPGGVGPMTITMLLQNTLHAAELSLNRVGAR
jgi:methylenetetrahydrofolate dehydrogenase (NADP+) / methenyltetrahydrofolate cyclohydrolase